MAETTDVRKRREEAIRDAEQASSARPAEAIVGDWTGEATPAAEAAAADLADLRRQIRRVYANVLHRRDEWANSTLDGAVARAVAYQNVAGQLLRVIQSNEARSRP